VGWNYEQDWSSGIVVKEQQRVDPELIWMVRWRETGEEPTAGELFIGDSRSKYYWVNREVFVLEKGIIWSKGEEGKSTVETHISATIGPISSSVWS
jgi:hypothetical protein